jgi:hypothetical protein
MATQVATRHAKKRARRACGEKKNCRERVKIVARKTCREKRAREKNQPPSAQQSENLTAKTCSAKKRAAHPCQRPGLGHEHVPQAELPERQKLEPSQNRSRVLLPRKFQH